MEDKQYIIVSNINNCEYFFILSLLILLATNIYLINGLHLLFSQALLFHVILTLHYLDFYYLNQMAQDYKFSL